jgi:hypothetical protein
MPSTSRSRSGVVWITSNTFSPKARRSFLARAGPMPRIIREDRYFSMPSAEVGGKCAYWSDFMSQALCPLLSVSPSRARSTFGVDAPSLGGSMSESDMSFRWCKRCKRPENVCDCEDKQQLEYFSPVAKLMMGQRSEVWEEDYYYGRRSPVVLKRPPSAS